jgi:TCP-1/cpn60 chaperonin family
MIPVGREISSSFGPFGSSKIVTDGSSKIIVTRDGRQILEHLELPNDVFSKLIIRVCERFADTFGDGCSTLLLISEHIVHSVHIMYPDLQVQHYSQRVKLLRALNVLISCFQSSHLDIQSHLISCGACTVVSSFKVLASGVWKNVLAPAISQDATDTLISLMVCTVNAIMLNFIINLILCSLYRCNGLTLIPQCINLKVRVYRLVIISIFCYSYPSLGHFKNRIYCLGIASCWRDDAESFLYFENGTLVLSSCV